MQPDLSDDETATTLRPLLFSIAYRMLGEVGEAEDLTQEALLRLHAAHTEGVKIQSQKAYATTIVSRLAIDHLRSSRIKREEYVGQWLPEPVVSEPRFDPADHAEMADSLSMAFLVLLESLSPPERAVFLLRDVFSYDFEDIAEIIKKSPSNTRQIAVRARRAIDAGRHRFDTTGKDNWELAKRFIVAVDNGDLDGLVGMLASDAMIYGDGGSNVSSRPAPVVSAAAVAALLLSTPPEIRARQSVTLAEVNGQPGAVVSSADGTVNSVIALDILDGQVQTVRVILNPEKLIHVRP